MRGGDHGRAAEGVPDEQAHLAAGVVHELHRADGVGDLVGERPVAPVALGVAQAEVVEAQHADALAGELLADPARCRAVLAEGEAVGEHAPSAHLALGTSMRPAKRWPGGADETDALCHAHHLIDTGGRITADLGRFCHARRPAPYRRRTATSTRRMLTAPRTPPDATRWRRRGPAPRCPASARHRCCRWPAP